jgi:hypothetical protein
MWSGDDDPQWVVIEIALDDLHEAGIVVDDHIDVAALSAAAASISTRSSDLIPARLANDTASLSVAWAKALGKKRTARDVGEGVFAIGGLVMNKRDRAGRRLPEPVESDDHDAAANTESTADTESTAGI